VHYNTLEEVRRFGSALAEISDNNETHADQREQP